MSANQYSAQPGRLTVNPDAQAMIDVARKEGIETVWDRLAAQQPNAVSAPWA